MPVPSAPTQVFVQAGDNLAYLSWANVSGATSYKIQRSNDGVTYADLATPTVNLYSDTSVAATLAVTAAGAHLIVGNRYIITTVGTTTTAEWNTIGVPTTVTPAIGVTFTANATGAGSGTGFAQSYGNLFYYQVAGVNGSGTGSYTSTDLNGVTLSVIPAAPGLTTLGNLRLQAQERADRVGSNFVTVPEWNRYISLSYKELIDILIQKYGDDYQIQYPYTYTTSGTIDPNYNAQVFPLPNDFYKLMLCEVALNPSDPNSWITLRQYERIQQNLYNYPNVYTFYGITNLRYRLTGTQLQIVPIASGGQTIRIWYVPRPATLVKDTDLVDGISGWEEYVIVDAAIKALKKEESDCTELLLEKQALMARIESAAENRNIAEPQRVSDSRTRNFSWGDDSSSNGNGNW